jgi:hypothetical protein
MNFTSKTILNKIFHICDSCWEELLNLKNTWVSLELWQVREKIEGFFQTTPKRPTILDKDGIEKEFNRLTQ